jgi:acylphosphatase
VGLTPQVDAVWSIGQREAGLEATMIRTVHVIISGRVQGIGYRAWTEDQATRAGLSGWVRNRRDNTVEALFSGEASSVEAMIDLCRSGPRLAAVDDVAVLDAPMDRPPQGFRILPTA